MPDAQVQISPLFYPGRWENLARNGVMDPYALWGLATKFRTLRQRVDGVDKVTDMLGFVMELPQAYDSAGVRSLLSHTFQLSSFDRANKPWGDTPPGLAGAVGNIDFDVPDSFEGKAAHFVTLRIDWSQADNEKREEAVLQLLEHTIPHPLPKTKNTSTSNRGRSGNTAIVKRVQMGDPRGWNNRDLPKSGKQPNTLSACAQSDVVLGVIEDDGPFAHAGLGTQISGRVGTRVLALWDQTTTRPSVGSWSGPLGFRYGRQLDQTSMCTILRKYADSGVVDEDAVYADPEVHMPRLEKPSSHAAAVTTLMASAERAAPRMPQAVNPDDGLELETETEADPASQACVVMVQLPVEQTTLSSGRWLAVNALDGLRYILDVARRDGRTPGVVVNMSYGAMAGAHDGTGMLEEAIDELVGQYSKLKGNLAVVLAAGNSHGVLRDVEEDANRLPSGMHANATILPGNKSVLTLFIPPDKQTETHVELWFDLHFPTNGRHGVGIVITPPNGKSWKPVRCSDLYFWPEKKDSDHIEAGLLFCSHVAQGRKGSMALLTIAATQVNSIRVSAPAGRWQIEVFNELDKSRSLEVEAWVERDDTTVGARRGQSARFVNMGTQAEKVQPDDRNSLTNVATGNTTFVAGAVFAGHEKLPLEKLVAPYSAEGADSKHGPLLSAVAEAGQALRGIRVSGSQSGMVVRANGTSMAAPQAARWIANQLARGRKLRNIRRELKKKRPLDARVGCVIRDPSKPIS